MHDETTYEKWRQARSRIEPQSGFADRVMQRVRAEPAPEDHPVPSASTGRVEDPNRSSRWMRLSLCAAATLVALFRIAELLSVFSTAGIAD